jgi:hypothetical protein
MVNGDWVVQNNKHAKEQSSANNFAKLLAKLSTN